MMQQEQTAMNAKRLLQHYERIADAPDAIARLRRFILDLAVRGKLVAQDPNDEPASELLKRIAKEKARLVKAGEARKLEVDPVALGDQPFAVPSAWTWTRLGTVGDWGSGSTPPRGASGLYGGNVTWLKSGELNDNRALAGSEETVTEVAIAKGSFRINKPGDVLIAMYGATIGKVAILAESAVTNQAVCGCTPFAGVFNQFLFLFLLSQREQFHSASEGGAQPNISKVKIVWTPFPLPPLAEQHRIVAKVDELMGLCDRLEAARAGREETRDRLAAASLARLNAPDATVRPGKVDTGFSSGRTAQEEASPAKVGTGFARRAASENESTFQDDARFVLDALPALATRPDQIKRLRQTILNLAVRGLLVPQDPNDEPASELLKRIAADKADRASSARDRRAAKIRPLAGKAVPFPVPPNWLWAAFGDITISRDGERIPVSREEREQRAKVFDYYGASGVIDKIDGFLFDKPLLMIGEDGANLINRSTPIAFIARGKYWVNNHAHVLDGLSEGFLRYVELFINAIDLKPYVTGTAQPKMNQAKMNCIPVALPPLAEQHRIVAKVDALMALCDRLEASLTATDATRLLLLDALLAEVCTPADVGGLEATE